MIEAPVRPGDVVAGKYRVERLLGAGAVGVVVAAVHVELGQRVAVKFMRSAQHATADARARFLREARAAVRLRSQHVARVFDVGALESGAPYIVMEFLEGRDLAALLKESGCLSLDDAVEYVLQTCEAVGEAHAAGIVHRDLKPANLFVTQDVSGAPCIKVLDFGISKISGAELALTDDDQQLGTPYYMSPEQMSSPKDVDPRSDVWALGVLLYELIAGQTPFHAETMAEFYWRMLAAKPTPLHERRSDVPPEIDAVIQRCLMHDREQRWSDVAAFAGALAPHAAARAPSYPERVSRVLSMSRSSSPGARDTPEPRRVEASSPPASAGAARSIAPRPPDAMAEAAPAAPWPYRALSPFVVLMSKPRNRAPLLLGGAFFAGAAVAVIAWGGQDGGGQERARSPAPTDRPAASFGAPNAAPSAPVAPQAPPSAPASPAASAEAQAEPTSPSPAATATRKATKPAPRAKPPAKDVLAPKPEPAFSYDERR
ncbi:serine/threonine-protein kinase [Sorangium sp. So ce426]|uniref:serine/threonine-protein kinase n=1 Tax=Sorangium sp. So ce426 TaxID=3133312 RepID=UPI003F5B256A